MMTHHDAITGTHHPKTGLDYSNMMQGTQEFALSDESRLLSHAVEKMAMQKSLEIKSHALCTFEGIIIICDQFSMDQLANAKS